uniref:Uncharacterized protein n=1 Tax=Anguilla anguilla TaxID=7936 RepID=A0A0E9RAQ1_ANGAN
MPPPENKGFPDKY